MDKKKLNKMLLILGIMSFFANGDNYAAAPLLIDIARDLNIGISNAALSVTAYMLAFGFFTIIFGPLGDRFGKTKIIKITAFGTAIFSCLGAFAFNLNSLIIVRAINGAFAAGIFPVTMALIGESFDDSMRQNAIGKVMGMMFLGGASATVIGGAVAYIGSWRTVYIVYGIAELIIALIMLKALERSPGVIDKLSYGKVYGEAFKSKELIKVVCIIFFMGFSVFGSFTYSGQLVKSVTGYNIFIVGLVLSIFGIGTVIGGRKSGALRQKFGKKFLLIAGVIGSISLMTLSFSNSVILIGITLFGFGLAFVLLQSTLVMTAQQIMPKLRGTAMSLASFNMFVGGGIGTLINRRILNNFGVNRIFSVASIIMLIVGIAACIMINYFQMRINVKHQRNVEQI